jgi:hypothetical protein
MIFLPLLLAVRGSTDAKIFLDQWIENECVKES